MQIHTAFILGAGLGTRLKRLTQQLPKPLVPVANRPLITYAFDHLRALGVDRFVINTHWLADVYPATFPQGTYRDSPLIFREETPEVLETAGGLKNAEDLLGGAPFIVYNGDILSDLPLAPAVEHHFKSGNEVTLILRSQGGPLQVGWNAESGLIKDIGSRLDPSSAGQFLFTGIYVVNPEFLARIPAGQKLSVIPIFLEMIRCGAKLGGIVLDEGGWWDLGSRDQYLAVHSRLAKNAPWIDPSVILGPGAQVTGCSSIGPGVIIEAEAHLHDCIVWEGAHIERSCALNRCIVTAGTRVGGIHSDLDF